MSDFAMQAPLLALAGLGVGAIINSLSARVPQWIARLWHVSPEEIYAPAGSLTLRHGPWREVAVLCVLALVMNWAFFRFGWTPRAAAAVGACAVLVALALVDLDTRLLPDMVSVPLLVTGLACNWAWGLFATPRDAMVGMAGSWVALMAAHLASRWLGRGEGIGQGDAKMLAAIGAWLGWQMACDALLVACVSACLIGVAGRLVRHRAAGELLPFGPFLALGGVVEFLHWPFELGDLSAFRALM